MDGAARYLISGLVVFICFCQDSTDGHFNKSDVYTSLRFRRQSCGNSELQCTSGQCIDKTASCDGVKDCNDGSDETSNTCRTVRCPPYAFQCSYGACVDGRAKCNGTVECADESDEKHPSCTKPAANTVCKNLEFHCKSGKCIDNTLLCDGIKDCDDSSDETFEECNKFRCPSFTFRCSYGGCIDSSRKCDGRPHCVDASDEDPALCGTPQKPPDGCKLPSKPDHGSFNILNCGKDDTSPLCQKIPGSVAPDYTILDFQCDTGYKLAGRSSNPCVGGQWTNPHPTCVAVSCNELQSVSVEIKCSLKGNKVPCDKPMAPGTEALLSCRVPYKLTNEPGYNKIFCQEDGTWNKPVFTCVQDCGRRNPDGKPFISFGEKAKVGEFPWHVGIYRYDYNDELEQICGGSLVNPDTVVTAAHCFWSENYKKPNDKALYRVAAGKYFRDWNQKDIEMQEREIKELILHEEYRGRPAFYRNDIAIVKLNISVQLTWAVLPVCLDFNNDYERFQLVRGNPGTIVGWGVTEKNEASESLITTQLPYIDFPVCWDTVPATFQPYVTKDKFCAGYTNGTSVCPGDSGGGLAFDYEKRFYLRGIVSIGVEPEAGTKCFINQYTAFTKVSDYLPWIENYMR